MSLALRESCQDLLDKVGLDMLHVEVQNKTLAIIGQCGKQIVSIAGIQASTSLSKQEVAYATKLFDLFLTKYGKDIQNLIKHKKAFAGLVKPKYNDVDVSISGGRYSYTLKDYSIECQVLNLSKTIQPISIGDFNYSIKAKTLDDIIVTTKLISDEESNAVVIFKALNEYLVLDSKIKDLTAKINSCTI